MFRWKSFLGPVFQVFNNLTTPPFPPPASKVPTVRQATPTVATANSSSRKQELASTSISKAASVGVWKVLACNRRWGDGALIGAQSGGDAGSNRAPRRLKHDDKSPAL